MYSLTVTCDPPRAYSQKPVLLTLSYKPVMSECMEVREGEGGGQKMKVDKLSRINWALSRALLYWEPA